MASIGFDESKHYYATCSLVIGYALCSSLLAVINKYAITKFNYPGLLTTLQYLTSSLGVYILGKLGFLSHNPFKFNTAKKFMPAAIVFYLAIFANMNLLRHTNVDTFLVFRSLTPLLVAIADTAFRDQPCPSKLTFMSLVIILGGAFGYVATDSGFTLTAYSWAFAYLITITTEMVYIKHMVMNLGLNTWGFVLYNNLLSLMMAPLFWVVTGEYTNVFNAVKANSVNWFDMNVFFAVSLSCLFGLLISFFGFAARKAISATVFTVTGVVKKFLTVLINELIWDKHASPFGLVCLLITIAGGVLYQQSVTGASVVSAQRDSAASKQMDNKSDSPFAVSLSCVFGLLISFFGFAARKAISATAFTVISVVNKFLTVLINVLIWDKHASPFGLVCLLITIGGGVLYQQSVTGASSVSAQRDSAASKQTDNKSDGDDYGEDKDEEKSISGKLSGV